MAEILKTTREVAKLLGRHRDTVSRNARNYGIGTSAGPGTPLYFTDADIECLRGVIRDKPGNPKFGDPEFSARGGRAGKNGRKTRVKQPGKTSGKSPKTS